MMLTKKRKPKRVSVFFYDLLLPFSGHAKFAFVSLWTEKKAFRARMKGHYKGEFNAAALLKQKPPPVEDDEDEKWTVNKT